MAKGRIIKALSGFYYVKTEDGAIYQCRGRGVFRNQKITPLVGDLVTFEYENPNEGYIMEIMPRSNELVRPPISNITQAIIVTSAKAPDFNQTLLDRFLVLIESRNIQPVIFITKMDLASAEEKEKMEVYRKLYEDIGYRTELLSMKDEQGFNVLEAYFKDHITVIAGQSGVGKSSILNMLDDSLDLKTGEISESLGRGRHTTRHVELLEMYHGLVADTPGFSSLEFETLEANELSHCFPEFRKLLGDCKFRGCMHLKEPKCAVKAAVSSGEIAALRYENYVRFLEEITLRKPRY
ncbi:ribosome small subunit-dependent GTPase A [Oceanobacillus alkalisoli]|uniref:ribosome small subunit-dependent GTPase A n=1 Tax=Oceanobacillus alkalisoli TaxID=2925113 RepID=UPI001EF066DA|nr:ribosome small subunit-dependent GTPase A [Oceanobacillus alkalisoli]MCF3942479.1 ribosome small subunit-dependent GTPase A [Oceanobacillus alkalisoli]MCG5103536.1 ribosome small subunit-dependent GTPase A [Oceanobacillus alkalisoli]